LGITRTNNIHLFKVEMGNGICDESLMLGNGTPEGIYGTATHELGHSCPFWELNEFKHPWMDEGFTTHVSDLAENATKKKVANPLEGKL
jgi:hypothetical protein